MLQIILWVSNCKNKTKIASIIIFMFFSDQIQVFLISRYFIDLPYVEIIWILNSIIDSILFIHRKLCAVTSIPITLIHQITAVKNEVHVSDILHLMACSNYSTHYISWQFTLSCCITRMFYYIFEGTSNRFHKLESQTCERVESISYIIYISAMKEIIDLHCSSCYSKTFKKKIYQENLPWKIPHTWWWKNRIL